MTIPYTIPLESGGAVVINTVGGKVMMVVPADGAVLTRAECEHVGDALWQAGVRVEPPKSLQVPGRAKPITSVEDERVRGNG